MRWRAALMLAVALGTGFVGPYRVAAEGDGAPTFNVWEFRVDGNTLLERTQVERTVYRHLGPDRTIDDVEAARRELELLYRNSGYPTVVVNLPEQDVSDGVVSLEVVQGRVDRLRISNARYFSLGRIREGVPALAEGEVPYFPQVQEELAALNRASGDRRITPIFRPGRTPGAVEVELRVKDQLPLHTTFELNDQASRDTSRLRASLNLRYANLWQREHSLSVQAQVSPQDSDDSRVLSATYVMPLENRHLLAVYGVRSESDVATAGDIAVIGNGTILGTRYIMPMAADDDYFHSASLGVDYKDFDESVELLGGDTLTTPIDYLNFSAEYQGTRLGEGAETSFNLGANFGVRGLGNSEEEFANKRFQARPNYFHLNGGADYAGELTGGHQLMLSLEGQLADGALISNQQFSIGGMDSVRGYYESQVLGDDGLRGSLELSSRSFASAFSEQLRSLRLFAFADGGYVRTRDPLPGQERHQEIYGTGIGLRLLGPRGLRVELDWAWPLKDEGEVQRGDSRGHFRIEYEM